MDSDEEIVVSLAAALPKGEHNGLSQYAQLFADFPKKIRPALVLLDCVSTTEKYADDSRVAKIRVRRIELIRDEGDAKVVERILMRAFEARTGAMTLPFELEVEVKSAFEEIDLNEVTEEERKEALEAAEAVAGAGLMETVEKTFEAYEEERDPTAGPWFSDETEEPE